MARVCDRCGKGVDYGHLVSHAKNRTKTIRKPNLHSARVIVDGNVVRQRLCTKCLRRADRPGRDVKQGEENEKKNKFVSKSGGK